MKKYTTLFISFIILVSCAQKETDIDSAQELSDNEILCIAPSMDYEEQETRSTMNIETNATTNKQYFAFNWSAGDKLTVYSDDNFGIFNINTGEEGKNTAKFTGGGFSLTKGNTYYALSKSSSTLPSSPSTPATSDFNFDSKINVKFSYAGQCQEENSTSATATKHLGMYDFMAAVATAETENSATFNFKHLGIQLWMVIKGLPENITYTDAEIYESGANEYRQPVRSINLTSGYDQNTGTYTPQLFEPDLTNNQDRFKLKLGSEGFTTSSDNTTFNLFMALPPCDLNGKTLVVHLNSSTHDTDKSNDRYIISMPTREWKMGNTYKISGTARQTTNFTINVQVVQDWIKGNTVQQTRSVGDPGTTETFPLPKYLYAFFVNGGKLYQTATSTDVNWSKATDGIYNYTGKWKLATSNDQESDATSVLSLDGSASNAKVYIIASDRALSFGTFSYGTSGTSEATIKALTYNYENQEAMKNLYSTPYPNTGDETTDAANFTGTLSDEFKTVRLYHVASRVDVNWENETGTALTGTASVNHFQTTGLSYFLPSTGNDAYNSTYTGSESDNITPGIAYNGRAYWYVPQSSDATYNVTIGNKTQNITFTGDKTYTSWFRGLITMPKAATSE